MPLGPNRPSDAAQAPERRFPRDDNHLKENTP